MVGTAEQIKNGPWLVKSGDRVLGPFSNDQISQLLKDREIVVIDEIMSPEGRWAYLRDVAAFASVVDEIRRGLMTSREDTEIQGYTNTVNSGDSALTLTPTERTGAVSSQTVTEIAKPVGLPASVLAPRERKADLRQLGFDPPSLPPAQVKSKRPPGLAIGAVIIVLSALFMIFTAGKKSSSSDKVVTTANTETLQRQASVAWKRGEFPQALELYRAIDRQSPGQPQVTVRLALLMMQLEGQTVEAKRVLQTALDKNPDPESRAQIEIALGLAALHNENANEAVTRFNAAGATWIAAFNRGVAYVLLKDWNPAIKAFAEAGAQPIALLNLARAQLSAAESAVKTSSSAALRKDADVTIAKSLTRFADYHQETLVVGAYADILNGNARRAEARINEAIDTDPDQTNDHFHDPALSLDAASWQQLLPLCRSIQAALDTTSSRTLLGLCLAKADRLEDASKLIDNALAREPSSALLHSANAYLHMTAERDDAARASLTLSSKAGASRLTTILSSRLCVRERNDACAEEGWSKLASEPAPPLAAYTGLAQIKFQKSDSATGNALLVNAEKISPTYLPLLRLREDASR